MSAPFRRGADGSLVAEHGGLAVMFDGRTGAVRRVRNVDTGHVLELDDGPPWRLIPQGTEFRTHPVGWPPSYRRVDIEPRDVSIDLADDGSSAHLTWETSEEGIRVEVTASFGDGALELRPRVQVDDGVEPPDRFTYPLLSRPGPLSPGGERDQLVFPAHSGWIIRRPLDQDDLTAPYPDGYYGCSVQLTAYFEEGSGGFSLAAHDPHSTWKDFAFGRAEWSITHHTWDLRPGAALDYGYPLVIAPLTRGDWHEAVDGYRRWARTAPWSVPAAGHGVDRAARAWLQEEVGLVIWGAPSSEDWSPWYRYWAGVAGTPLHICAGWDWPARHPHCVGREGWFPARFHPANVAAWEGHYVTPYMNDCFISYHAEGFLDEWEPELVFPYATFPWSPLAERAVGREAIGDPPSQPLVTTDLTFYVCPATEAQAELHAWRDRELVERDGVAGVCYDISSAIPVLASRCLRSAHGHPPGRGRHLIEAFDRINRRSKEAVRAATGRYLVQGVETIVENLIGSVDFYVSRAAAGPLGALETWTPAPEEPPGAGRELIPLFQAVYHDFGPVHHDGWLNLYDGTGNLFFWAAARIVLQWGGLLSFHYATNPPERVADGHERPRLEYWDGVTVEFNDLPDPDPRKEAFTRELALTRTALATKYVAHGRMLRPIPLDVDDVVLSFEQRFHTAPRLVNSGAWPVPSVVQGAWEAPDGSIGLLFVALEGDVPLRVEAGTGDLWGRDRTGARVTVRTLTGVVQRSRVGAGGRLDLAVDLPSRTVHLLEIEAGEP